MPKKTSDRPILGRKVYGPNGYIKASDRRLADPKDSPESSRYEVKSSAGHTIRWVVKRLDKKSKSEKPSSKAGAGIISTRVRDSDGKMLVYRIVDANNARFGVNFDNVFRSNVRKARRANKLVVGTPNRGTPES